MINKTVKNLMLPLDHYAVVTEDSTLLEAFEMLEKAQEKLEQGRQPHRAVLVVNKANKVVGRLGHLGFLKALEPKYKKFGDLHTVSRSGFSAEFLSSMMESFEVWQDNPEILRRRAQQVKVKDAMHPVKESIDEDASLGEAMHRIIMWQTLSVLVHSGNKIVGILRLSDLFDEVAEHIRETEK
jgi:CBS domain-containing protein